MNTVLVQDAGERRDTESLTRAGTEIVNTVLVQEDGWRFVGLRIPPGTEIVNTVLVQHRLLRHGRDGRRLPEARS